MKKNLSLDELKPSFIETASLFTGSDRRAFQAMVTLVYLDGSPRKAESYFGWNRNSVFLGIKEYETGIECIDNFNARGNTKTEDKLPNLEEDIRSLVDPKTHADPKFQSTFVYTRITAKAVRQGLIEDKGYSEAKLPTCRTISSILNRLGYHLKRILKTKPQKKIKETDAIFENVHKLNKESDENPESLRISVDTKAKVKIGPFSRGGKSREEEAPKASDHDMNPIAKLVPCGILEVNEGQLTTVVGNSHETSDFIVDALEIWWEDRKHLYPHIKELVINIDNGPSVASHRTQFIKRIIKFANANMLQIHLVYYPPYHSKYNPIEHCWGVLENNWNGTILDSIDKAIEWMKTMTWKGLNPVIHWLDKVYVKGVKLTKEEMGEYNDKLKRSETLPKWDVIIGEVQMA